jgi:hypothetical protein
MESSPSPTEGKNAVVSADISMKGITAVLSFDIGDNISIGNVDVSVVRSQHMWFIDIPLSALKLQNEV